MSYLDGKSRNIFHDATSYNLDFSDLPDEKPGFLSNIWSTFSSTVSSSYNTIKNVTVATTSGIALIPKVFQTVMFDHSADINSEMNYDHILLTKIDPSFAELIDLVGSKIANDCALPLKGTTQEAIQLLKAEGNATLSELSSNSRGIDEKLDLMPSYIWQFLKGTLFGLSSSAIGLVDIEHFKTGVKANISRISVNLLKAATNEQNKDQKPIVRITALLTKVMNEHFSRAKEIQKSNASDKEAKFKEVFVELTEELIDLALPNEESDILLPFDWPTNGFGSLSLAKLFAYNKLKEVLPEKMLQLFEESSVPLIEREPEWKLKFNKFVGVSGADKVVGLPSTFLKSWMKDEGNVTFVKEFIQEEYLYPKLKGKYSDDQAKTKSMWLASELTTTFQQLIETEDDSLKSAGTFLQSYFMEQLVWNLYQSQQNANGKKLILSVAEKVSLCYHDLTEKQKCEGVAKMLLNMFGLDKKETFPLPKSVKTDAAWNHIQSFTTDWVSQQLVPLVHNQVPKEQLDALTGDTFFSTYVSTMVESVPNLIMPQVKQVLHSMEGLSQTQKNQLCEQIAAAIKKESFLKEYLKTVLFKVASHVGKNHQQSNQQAQANGAPSTLIPWTTQQVTGAFDALDIDRMSPGERDVLVRAMALKNAKETNSIEYQNLRAEVDPLLKQMIKPKFMMLIHNLLKVAGFEDQSKNPPNSNLSDLPVPLSLQKVIWSGLDEKLSGILLDQSIDLLIPLLEMQRHKEELTKLSPNVAKLFVEGSESLPKDLRNQMTFWIRDYWEIAKEINTHHLQNALSEDQLKELAQNIAGLVEHSQLKADTLLNLIKTKLITPLPPEKETSLLEALEGYQNDIEGIVIVPETVLGAKVTRYTEGGDPVVGDLIPREWQSLVVKELNAFIQTDQTEYSPVWTFIKTYLNGFFLKLSVQASKMDNATYSKIQALISQKKGELAGKNIEESKPIIADFGNQFLALIGLSDEKQLYGVPAPLQPFFFQVIKDTLISKVLSDAHWVYTRFKRVQLPSNLQGIRDQIDVDKIPRATKNSIAYATDVVFHKLEEQAQNGLTETINSSVQGLLEQHAPAKVGNTAGIVKKFVESGSLKPVIDSFIKDTLLNEDSELVRALRSFINEQLNPILMDKLLKLIETPLRRERNNGREFNQELLKKILPPLIDHLTHLNEVKAKEGKLDAAASVSNEELAKLSKDLIRLIFPNGEDDVIELFPEELRDRIGLIKRPIWNELNKRLPDVLPEIIPLVMNRDMLVPVLTKIFDELADQLPKEHVADPHPITEDSQKIDRMVGQIVIEAARLLDLPIDKLESLPLWMRRFFGVETLKESTFESIGKALRLRFGGDFVQKLVDDILDTLENLRYEKLTPDQKVKRDDLAEVSLHKAQDKLVGAAITAAFTSLGERIMEYLAIDPAKEVLTGVRDFFKNICLFIISKILVPIIRLIGLQSLVIRKGSAFLSDRTERGVKVLQTTHLHDKFFIKEIDGLKPLLRAPA